MAARLSRARQPQIHESTGHVQNDGDTVACTEVLTVKGSRQVAEVFTKVHDIQLVEGDYDMTATGRALGRGAKDGVRKEGAVIGAKVRERGPSER